MAVYKSKTTKGLTHKSSDLISRHKKFLKREQESRMSRLEGKINFNLWLINSDAHRGFRG